MYIIHTLVLTLVQCGNVAVEAPQSIQGTQLAKYWSETSWCVLINSDFMKPLETVVFNVGNGQGTAIINLNARTHKICFVVHL